MVPPQLRPPSSHSLTGPLVGGVFFLGFLHSSRLFGRVLPSYSVRSGRPLAARYLFSASVALTSAVLIPVEPQSPCGTAPREMSSEWTSSW